MPETIPIADVSVSVYTVADMFRTDRWEGLLTEFEALLGEPMHRLDTNDPIRKLAPPTIAEQAKVLVTPDEPDNPHRTDCYYHATWKRWKGLMLANTVVLHKERWWYTSTVSISLDADYLMDAEFADLYTKLLDAMIHYTQPVDGYGYYGPERGEFKGEMSDAIERLGLTLDWERKAWGTHKRWLQWLTYLHPVDVARLRPEAIKSLEPYQIPCRGPGVLWRFGDLPGTQETNWVIREARDILNKDTYLFADPDMPIEGYDTKYILPYTEMGWME